MAQTQRKTLLPSNSLDCIEKLVKCIERFNKGKIDADMSFKITKQILVNEFDDPEFLAFAIDNY
jgi:hypothetical protein